MEEEQTIIPLLSPSASPMAVPNLSPQDQIFHPEPSTRKPKKAIKLKRRRKKACVLRDGSDPTSSSSSTSFGFVYRRRVARLSLGGPGRSKGFCDVDAVALPLGMSFAAVVAQVLEREDVTGERMSIDHLSQICASAVREALFHVRKTLSCCLICLNWLYKLSLPCLAYGYFSCVNLSYCGFVHFVPAIRQQVFGCKFTRFIINFEKSFGSTLSTLRLLRESSSLTNVGNRDTVFSENELTRGNLTNRECSADNYSTREVQEPLALDEEVRETFPGHDVDGETSTCNRGNELTCFSDSLYGALIDQPVFSTFERSIMEQRRSNDLKELELSLSFRKMKLKETQLSLSNDANHLERSKLAMGTSKASFRAEKFKNELEDTRYAELLRKCIDCLVASLLLMSASLAYGAYVFSYRRITEATVSCAPNRGSKSWWIPEPVASLNSGFQMLSCQVLVLSRMLFGILMILVVAYLLLQRSTASNQSMPITFLLLLLGVACGFAGKLCVDTLGGSGNHWLFFWEAMCLVHFFSNIFTSTLFVILHGPLAVSSQRMKPDSTIIPYWVRRCIFYGVILVVLPLLCGLLPFGDPIEWKEHVSQLLVSGFSSDDDGNWN